MFETLADKLEISFKRLRGQGTLSEQNLKSGLREVRMALLEADVNYKVAKDFIESVRQGAIGQDVLKSITPGQQVVKIVNDELVKLMGGDAKPLSLSGASPVVIMLAGLQGSGKTTTAAKLAKFLVKESRRPCLVPADVYRPAAVDQLKLLAEQVGVKVFPSTTSMKTISIAKESIAWAVRESCDVVIVDTAGRLHVDEPLMNELIQIKEIVNPREILFVADAMTGQDAVNVAKQFNDDLDITGIILTKMDGDARGGAALSIRQITDKPIKFVGVGEKINALEVFHPERMASRILGMGDVLTLVEKAQQNFDMVEANKLESKLRTNNFTLNDFKKQLQMIKKLGSMEQILGMIPGMGKLKQLKGLKTDGKELIKTEAIINSMTFAERNHANIINGSRRKRIAKGSGTTVNDVNQLLKNYDQICKIMKQFTASPKGKGKKGKGKKRQMDMMKGLFSGF